MRTKFFSSFAMALVLCLSIIMYSCSGGSSYSSPNESGLSYDEAGYNFLLNRLNAPSTAVLLGTINKDKMRSILKNDAHYTYPSDVDWESYKVETTNTLGGRETHFYPVLFHNGKPIGVDTSFEAIFNALVSGEDFNPYLLENYSEMVKDVYGLNIKFQKQ